MKRKANSERYKFVPIVAPTKKVAVLFVYIREAAVNIFILL